MAHDPRERLRILPMDRQRQRFRLAVAIPYTAADVKTLEAEGSTERLDDHMFDFEDGLRMIIARVQEDLSSKLPWDHYFHIGAFMSLSYGQVRYDVITKAARNGVLVGYERLAYIADQRFQSLAEMVFEELPIVQAGTNGLSLHMFYPDEKGEQQCRSSSLASSKTTRGKDPRRKST